MGIKCTKACFVIHTLQASAISSIHIAIFRMLTTICLAQSSKNETLVSIKVVACGYRTLGT